MRRERKKLRSGVPEMKVLALVRDCRIVYARNGNSMGRERANVRFPVYIFYMRMRTRRLRRDGKETEAEIRALCFILRG